MEQGNEPGSLRPCLSSAKKKAFNFVLLLLFGSANPKSFVAGSTICVSELSLAGQIGDKS